ncbi:MAG: hypothetical protein JXX14_03080 [Deltaproteobacteria bacterium]|nr:hypothetical protein [Deltaproteobacteria bacterium]
MLSVGLKTGFTGYGTPLQPEPMKSICHVLWVFLFSGEIRYTTALMLPFYLTAAIGAGPTLGILGFEGEPRHPMYSEGTYLNAQMNGSLGIGIRFSHRIGLAIF